MKSEIYDKILEHFTFEMMYYDYMVFECRFLYVDFEIKFHPSSTCIDLTVNELSLFNGRVVDAPDMSPYNLLKLSYKIYGDSFIKSDKLKKIHKEIMRSYHEGYNLNNFLKNTSQELHTYTVLLVNIYESEVYHSYKFRITKYNNKILPEVIYDEFNTISKATRNSKIECGITPYENLINVSEPEVISSLLLNATNLSAVTMNRLSGYFRKQSIDEILRNLEDVP